MVNMIYSEVGELRLVIFVIFKSNTVVTAFVMPVMLPVVDLNETKFGSSVNTLFFPCLFEGFFWIIYITQGYRNSITEEEVEYISGK